MLDLNNFAFNDGQIIAEKDGLYQVKLSGNGSGDSDSAVGIIRAISNYPNPFNPTTTISFDLAKPGPVTIDVFNIKGQKMQALVDNSFTAGQHSITWDGTDSKGKPVASGVYFYRMTTPKSTLIHKMLLIKVSSYD
ncbi:MAG: T9SS type A sorting domain-containing protein [Candidatus Cloacimonadaceae bacterium]